jgi:hypothetical protein
MRQIPLATPFGRLAHERGGTRGVILSAAVHVATVVLLLWTGSRLMVADRAPGSGPGRGGGGGGGGNRTLVLFVPPAPAAPAPVPPAPAIVMPTQPVVVVPEVRPDTTPRAPDPAQPAAPGQGPGEGAGKGPGAGPGSGTGSGGGTGSGVGPGTGPDSGGGGGRVYPPQPQGIILPPPDRPSALRGTTVTAVFEISATGEVMHVALDPSPRDHKFANAFLERLRRFTFTPAYTLDGHPVAALFRINITL